MVSSVWFYQVSSVWAQSVCACQVFGHTLAETTNFDCKIFLIAKFVWLQNLFDYKIYLTTKFIDSYLTTLTISQMKSFSAALLSKYEHIHQFLMESVAFPLITNWIRGFLSWVGNRNFFCAISTTFSKNLNIPLNQMSIVPQITFRKMKMSLRTKYWNDVCA